MFRKQNVWVDAWKAERKGQAELGAAAQADRSVAHWSRTCVFLSASLYKTYPFPLWMWSGFVLHSSCDSATNYHRIQTCRVCVSKSYLTITTWKGGNPRTRSLTVLFMCISRFWRRYGSLSRHLMALKLQHYTKFLFVRDPFVRLISAFRNKFGRCVFAVQGNVLHFALNSSPCHWWITEVCVFVCVLRPNQDFYRQFGSVMLRRYGNVSGDLPETAAEAFKAGIKPTFQQFITYLLDPETEKESIFNEHWREVIASHKQTHAF